MKKGFTLTELLGVIVVLGLIALVVFPNVNKSLKNSKNKLYDRQVDLIEDAARRWGVEHTHLLPDSGSYYLELFELLEGGYVSGADIKDPRDNETMNGCIIISYGNNKYNYEYTSSACGENKPVIANADKSGASKPVLNGLIPIKWNGNNWIVADSNNAAGENQWYDYNAQMWANAASVTEEYRNAAIGTVVPEDGIYAYFVWIPRYEYMYTNLGEEYAGGTQEQPGEIKINFIEKNVTAASSSDYKVHPAFHFGGTEISGIWVGKFETTGEEDTPTIKPNLSSLRYQNVSTQFQTSQLFSSADNGYGINTSADAHMIKNSEWGAVAYLSQSKYGKYGNSNYTGANKEVYINYSDAVITGCSSGKPRNENMDYGCQYTYEKSTGGTGASTTGTIYGIYDMNGGAYENVMGIYNNEIGYSGFSSMPAAKYYDLYITEDATTACNNGVCYGHALSETMNWYFSNYGFDVGPWFTRDGVFSITINDGSERIELSFRVVLSAQ